VARVEEDEIVSEGFSPTTEPTNERQRSSLAEQPSSAHGTNGLDMEPEDDNGHEQSDAVFAELGSWKMISKSFSDILRASEDEKVIATPENYIPWLRHIEENTPTDEKMEDRCGNSHREAVESIVCVGAKCDDMGLMHSSDETTHPQCGSLAAKINMLAGKVDSLKRMNDMRSSSFRETSTFEDDSFSLTCAYEALLREHSDLKAKHHAMSIENDNLKQELTTAVSTYEPMRTINCDLYDFLHCDSKNLLQKEHFALKRTASLGSQSTACGGASMKSEISCRSSDDEAASSGASDDEDDNFAILTAQIY
jgi:hypothetical protein